MGSFFEALSAEPIAMVAFVLTMALLVDMSLIVFRRPPAFASLSREERRLARQERQDARDAADTLRELDLRELAQAVEDMIIDREHLTRILGTRALDLWIDLDIDERADGPTLRTKAKIVAFEPAPLDEDRIAQSARMIKRRVIEELTNILGPEADRFVNGGVTIETAIERSA